MKKTLEISTITILYNIIEKARLEGLDMGDKFAVIRICATLKPHAEQYGSYRKTASDKLKDNTFAEMEKQAQELVAKYGEQAPMDKLTEEEKQLYGELDRYFRNFNIEVEKCCEEEGNRAVELEFTPLTEKSFGKLMDTNKHWTTGLALQLLENIVKTDEAAK